MVETNPRHRRSLLREDDNEEESVYFYEDPLDTRETLINPFVSSSTPNGIMRRQRPMQPASSTSSTSTPVSLSNALPVFNVEDATLEEEQRIRSQHKTNYLEMEKSPTVPKHDVEDLLGTGLEPLSTTSGLLLTHRQTAPRASSSSSSSFRKMRAEMDYPSTSMYYSNGGDQRMHFRPFDARRWLSATKLWLVIFCLVLLFGTVTIWHSSRHEKVSSASSKQSYKTSSDQNINETFDKIVLLPLPSNWSTVSQESPEKNSRRLLVTKPPPLEYYQSALTATSHHHSQSSAHGKHHSKQHNEKHHEDHNVLEELRHEFEKWMDKHGKSYHSHHEKEKRFHIFKENHHRTLAKNQRHGPCRMTKEPVFGHNVFSDLTHEEFQRQFLTGYKGPKTDEIHQSENRRGQERKSLQWGHVLNPEDRVELHPTIQSKLESNPEHRKLFQRIKSYSYSGSCAWYEVSCWLRWFVNKYGYGWGGTLEPYNSNSYPGAVDWRNAGVVSDVHSQGNCGACWAITAVETIESAYAMAKGTLIDLAETEVILCDDTCDMCEGGWPQNAYEYVAKKGGLPQETYLQYDGDFLLGVTYSKNEESGYDTSTYESYVQQMCPGGGGGSGSGSNDNDYDGSQLPRYGKPKGYGYATDRCVCYTDGSGCDCDEQNEKLALNNVASYGPATVCLEASTWQDYAGGIMTSDIGCSASFLDMNHCVQAVGYAYVDSSDEEDGGGDGNSNSHSGSGDDDREGYWIIRNQWSSNWGMNGYAYVAMGENTCGVLNDMTIVYMK